jgi:hypothetical protein
MICHNMEMHDSNYPVSAVTDELQQVEVRSPTECAAPPQWLALFLV